MATLPRQRSNRTVLILTPVFVPDPASVGQHMADLATALADRGHRVLVYTANRGYDNPSLRYPARQDFHGVQVRRLPFSSFGKSSLLTRAMGPLSLLVQCFIRGLFRRNLAGIIITTSPPFSDLAGAFVVMFRPRIPLLYWAMDLYAEQVVALEKVSPTALSARFLQWVQRFILRRSTLIAALDRFMAARLAERAPVRDKLVIDPPWPHESELEPVDPATNPFRIKHGLQNKFVIMYSGNHTPTNPLTTLLQAAVHFKDDPDIRFLFVGGGNGKKEVEATIAEHHLTNTLSLPYQPLAELKYSLSAADLHTVTLGDKLVGIVHPCKVYGAMAVSRPILFLGPKPSHIADLMEDQKIGWQVSHGDVDGAIAAIQAARALDPQARAQMGQRAVELLHERFAQKLLCDRICDRFEKAMGFPPPPPPAAHETPSQLSP